MSGIATAAYFSSRDIVRKDIHFHNEYELIYVIRGCVKVTAGDTCYTASENHLILISNLEQHSVRNPGTVYERYCVTLDVAKTDRYIGHPRLLSLLKNHPKGFPHVLDATPFQDAALRIFQNMIRYKDSDFANELIVACITELLALLCTYYPTQFSPHASASEDKILKVQQYIDQHYKDPLKMDDLAKQFFISNCYLSHKFKELTGLSPKQYLSSVRLKNASVLLLNSDFSVSEIAETVGFPDHSNFIRSFKKIYGVLPKDFRRHQK